ncbi:MAG: sensor histidine kinase, partial [Actinomycetales bacterium]
GPEESDPGTHVVPPTITMECLANDLLAHGFTVRHRIDPAADALDPMTTRTITRILQEATTNILRHSTPGTTCTYTLTLDPDTVTISIHSHMSRVRDRGALSLGYGLRGLKERIDLTGGTFHAGPHSRHWIVQACIPYQPTPTPDGGQMPPGPEAPPHAVVSPRSSVPPRAVGGARGQAVLPPSGVLPLP